MGDYFNFFDQRFEEFSSMSVSSEKELDKVFIIFQELIYFATDRSSCVYLSIDLKNGWGYRSEMIDMHIKTVKEETKDYKW